MGLMNSFCSLTIFLAISAAFLTPGPVAAELDWKTCGTGLPKACGETIFHRVVSNRGPPPTDDCCLALAKIGKPCHDSFVREHVKDHRYKGSALPLLKRSDELWKECVQVVRFVFPPAGAPTST